ncbi:MAG: TIGR04157 family glycosyltransferase, partial [Prolixibacteraceae bacterium]|nr:TIGR04157 family glycosyltransferase [Prolixibacteraceae bacterium]
SKTQLEKKTISAIYLISLLFFIDEIRKKTFCPDSVVQIIALLPNFFLHHFVENINNDERKQLVQLLNNFDITSLDILPPNNEHLSSVEIDEISGQASFFSFIFGQDQLSSRTIHESNANLLFLIKEVVDCGMNSEIQLNGNRDYTYITGCLMSLLKDRALVKDDFTTQTSTHNTVYIFNRKKSRGSEYGIGTYIYELTKSLENYPLNIKVIQLLSDKEEFIIEDHIWHIPEVKSNGKPILINNVYFRSIAKILKLHIKDPGGLIFHLNYMDDYHLAFYLREIFECKLLLTMHYMDWTFSLQGDLAKIKKILAKPEDSVISELDKIALGLFQKDKLLLNYVDQIICLAEYASNILNQDYGIDKHKCIIINNGISDVKESRISELRSVLKHNYYIGNREKIILYAGRLDEVKGVKYLIKAFKIVLEKEPDCRLWIVGDGAYNPILREAKELWNKICFTGQISRDELFQLYRITDIGVVPSLFEPFGYVAVEMMMHGLPLVVTDTSGLSEIVAEGITGFKIQLINKNNINEVDIDLFAQKIIHLLQHPEQLKTFGREGRKRYLQKFTSKIMCDKMISCYQNLMQPESSENILMS